MFFKTLIFSILVILTFGCAGKRKADVKITEYRYSDGTGNTYIINLKNRTIKFKPVKRHLSSSGIYSGGKEKTKTLNDAELENITGLLKKAITNEDIHIENRVMLSGLIVVRQKKGNKVYILKPGSEEINKIETTLKLLLK